MDNTAKSRRYVALDTELGGIDLKYSLLQVYLVCLDENFQVLGELDLRLKPDDGDYIVCAEAMAVNHIDLVKHDAAAMTYSSARSLLGSWLRQMSDGGKIKLRALGHNVGGDIRFIWDKIYSREKWEAYVSYRQLDTATICQYLKDCHKVPAEVDGAEGVSGSLMSLVRYFGIPYEEAKLHDARTDTLLTVEVYKQMVAMLR